ncbi:MAG: hypothetical protein IIC62_04165, partial [Proteobacteria bacterium]|nr:hypothetical protein [Pseudomonadota bacterium]
AETFERYGIDRPYYLQDLVFEVVESGRADGNYISIRWTSAISEPFLTFLVEATWSRGRLLREYTVLLDPPTFAPQSTSRPAITAPQRSTATDSGRIDREPVTQPAPAPAQTRPAQTRPAPPPAQPKPLPVADDTPYDSAEGGGYNVQRGETLWGIASAMRPDSRLSMNQTMLAIYAANPQAFQGNINILSAGATLQIPSADDIYRIDRRDALSEVIRQHAAWGGYVPTTSSQPTIIDVATRPSLTLVPPDEDPIGLGTGEDLGTGDEPVTREQEIMDRIVELQAADVPIQQSLIEIRDNELAALRAELAEIRGEIYEPPLDDIVADDEFADDEFADDEIVGDEAVEDGITDAELPGDESSEDAIAADAAEAEDAVTIDASRGSSSVLIDSSPSFVDQAIGWLTSIWAIIAGAVITVAGLLFWFVRRDRDDEDDAVAWDALDADEIRIDPLEATETIQAPRFDDSIVVVEQDAPVSLLDGDAVEAPVVVDTAGDSSDGTGQFGSLEDTFSSETAVNLDQSDPLAEADFHMAYGLYDQAADLINGALQIEPERQDLLTKLCEIYFVWGNQDSFVDAAQRLHAVVGGGESADWDKIVIMGQQIAAEHELFAGAAVAGATKEGDLSFEDESEGTGALDMDFGDDGDGGADIIDLGAADDDKAVDFMLDDDSTEVADPEDSADATADFSVTAEMPVIDESSGEVTAKTPTIEEQFSGFDITSELPTIDETSLNIAIEESGLASDETAEIDLADLDLDTDDLAETELASLDDLEVTGTNEVLDDVIDVTGRNPQVDQDATGVQSALDPNATGMSEVLKMDDELASTSEMRLANDETGQNPMLDALDSDATDLGNLLDATGHTQILSKDMAVDTLSDEAGDLADVDATLLAPVIGYDDEETVLASLDDEPGEGDFDFAKTEALPPGVFTGSSNLDETGELPAVASTDVDLDLDDLTAALKVSEMGDTIEQPRDDATVEQPRPSIDEDDMSSTMKLAAGDMSDDLQEARTMTEVGTKLDLARAYVDMGDPTGARGILEEVLDEGDDSQRQQAQALLDSLPS